MRWSASLFRPACRWAGLFVVIVALAGLFAAQALADDQPCRPALVDRQRFGFVAVSADWSQTFAWSQLRAGWYVGSLYNGADPGDMDRALGIATKTGYTVKPDILGPVVDENPGSLWIIGNEPDCIWQDDVLPQEYARIYHDLYLLIKNRDLTSQIAAGGIVQPTPARLEYLDQVLAAYRARYGQPMPVDVWHIHNAILNEEQGGWGAEIPPGVDPALGVRRDIEDNDNLDYFRDQIWAFRQWMADNGYRGYPLIVTEYGVLMPKEYGFDEVRVNAFMSNTFDFLSTVTDPTLGDPTDGYRLVQRWAWFSLDVPPYEEDEAGFNGNLFNPDPDAPFITTFGLNYASHTSSFPPLEYVDLGVAAWDVSPVPLLVSPTQTISHSLQVRIVNAGTVGSGSFTVTLAHDGPASGTLAQTITNLPPVSSQWISFTLTDLSAGGYLLSVEIDPDGQVAEAAECNNHATRPLVVPRHRQHLPLTLSRSVGTPLRQGSSEAALDTRRSGSKLAARSFPLPSTELPSGFVEFEVPTANSYPAQLALDAERQVLWVAERDGNKLAAFDLQTETWGEEYVIPTSGSQPWGLAVAGDGNVWFAETAADKIGRLLVAGGTVTEFANLPEDSQPWDVAVGSDASVWFTMRAASRIGKLEPTTGTITQYIPPTPNAQPAGIAISGDYVWFVESAASKLGRLKMADGSIIEVRTPTSNSTPQGVTVDSYKFPWITETAVDRIARLKISTISWWEEKPVPTANSEPYGIAVDGSATVWFTERTGNKLGYYTGAIPLREYSLPTPNSLPTDIVIDGQGCAWYTAPGANQIGRFCLPSYTFDTYLPLVAKDQP